MDFSTLISREIDRKRKKSRAKPAPKKARPDAPPGPDQTAQLLHTVDDEKLHQALQVFDKHDATLSKEEQLHTLRYLVRSEKKSAQYEAYLAEENAVAATIDKSDIGQIAAEDVRWKLARQIRKFIKEILALWAQHTDAVRDLEHLLPETKKDVVKLLYKLRSRKLADDVLVSLATIVHYLQTQDTVRASESYLKLSIGNVAWPIGVRDVGIHARSADAKIAGDDKLLLANIMKDETTRRWLIAVKRLINYCEARQKSQAEA